MILARRKLLYWKLPLEGFEQIKAYKKTLVIGTELKQKRSTRKNFFWNCLVKGIIESRFFSFSVIFKKWKLARKFSCWNSWFGKIEYLIKSPTNEVWWTNFPLKSLNFFFYFDWKINSIFSHIQKKSTFQFSVTRNTILVWWFHSYHARSVKEITIALKYLKNYNTELPRDSRE